MGKSSDNAIAIAIFSTTKFGVLVVIGAIGSDYF